MKKGPPAVTVTLNPAIDRTLSIRGFAVGKVNRVKDDQSDPGGKGVNVAAFLADLDLQVTVTGFLGSENQDLFFHFFNCNDIDDDFVRVGGLTRVGLKIVDDLTQQTTDINFPGSRVDRRDIDYLFSRFERYAAPGLWHALGGSIPGGAPVEIYARLTELIHSLGGRVLLDTSGKPLLAALDSRPEVLKPNIDELSELVGRPLETPADVRAAAVSLLERGVQRVVVSMGADGALFVDPGRAVLARPPRVTVRSTVGAGDAMVAGILYAMIHEQSLDDVARMATACGAYAVTRIGPGMRNPAEIEKLMPEVEIEVLE
jgi:1-phosphofructokinase family hexose kinase